DNRSSATRQVLFYAYTHRWIRPRDDLRLDPGLLERLDPVKRQLLGAGTSALGYWIPTDDDVPVRTVGSHPGRGSRRGVRAARVRTAGSDPGRGSR
ncbi:MAG TPA: hypothetical protein VF101_04350, partial [Gaiellaceae bacterium]